MANTALFAGPASVATPNTVNQAGGVAYALGDEHALAQIALTGCFNGVAYATDAEQLTQFKKYADVVPAEFIAKLALHSRGHGKMKDMPCALLAVLATRDMSLFHKVFARVINNGRMIRTLFQMIRSGQFGKKSLSGSIQRAFQTWFNTATDTQLLAASIGNDPRIRDVLRMARPTPVSNSRRAMLGWLVDKPVEKWTPAMFADLPDEAKAVAAFRDATTEQEQVAIIRNLNCRWDLLSSSVLGDSVWAEMPRLMGAQALRMNLNTLQRHNVFTNPEVVALIASRLSDEADVVASGQMPYQYFAAYKHGDDLPASIRKALHTATEIACKSVPKLSAPLVIGLDVSGSMGSAVTGSRGSGTSKMRSVDVAALIAAALLRANPDSVVLPFDTSVHATNIDPSDSILSIADRLAAYGGGGTDCSLPLQYANQHLAYQITGPEMRLKRFAGVVMVSDNESWRAQHSHAAGRGTGMMQEWRKFQQTQQMAFGHTAKLVCIDLCPNSTSQAPDAKSVMNIGGFTDAVFSTMADFFDDSDAKWMTAIKAQVL